MRKLPNVYDETQTTMDCAQQLKSAWVMLTDVSMKQQVVCNPIFGCAVAAAILKKHNVSYETRVLYMGHPCFGPRQVLVPYCILETDDGLVDISPLAFGSKECCVFGSRLKSKHPDIPNVPPVYIQEPDGTEVETKNFMTTDQISQGCADYDKWLSDNAGDYLRSLYKEIITALASATN